MNKIKDLYNKMKNYLLSEVNLELLLFLILICNHRYALKLLAIGLFFLFNLKHRSKFKLDKINLFYLSMIAIGIFNLLMGNFSIDYAMVVAVGCGIWLLNLITHQQLTSYVNASRSVTIYNTIKLFTFLNFLISFADLLHVMFITGTINPYTQLSPPPYGAMSGDLIRGFFGEEHLTNSCVSGLLFIFLLYKKEFKIGVFALLTLLMASSNLTILAVMLFIVFAIIFIKDKHIKYYSIISFGIILTFYTKVNPSNYYEILRTFKLTKHQVYEDKTIEFALNNQDKEKIKEHEIDSLQKKWENEKVKPHTLSVNETKNKGNTISDNAPIANPKTQPVDLGVNVKKELVKQEKEQMKQDLLEIWQKRDAAKISSQQSKYYNYGNLKKFDVDSRPGLIISLNQTKDLLLSSPRKGLLGNGIGNFSSRIAFMSSKDGESSRIFDFLLPKYEHKDFKQNHKAIWKYVDYLGVDYHSIKHLPFSGYNQILGEYGLLGFISFIFFYIGYFAFKWKKLGMISMIVPLILIMFGMYYWFESFTLLIIFELLMLTEIKNKEELIHSKSEINE